MYYHDDTTGLEVDLIVELNDGRWEGIEVKSGVNEVDKASANVLKLATISTRKPAILMILTNARMAYQRPDGMYVIPLGCLKPWCNPKSVHVGFPETVDVDPESINA